MIASVKLGVAKCEYVYVETIDWNVRDLCLKFVKIREFYEIFKIRKNSFYNITSRPTCTSNSSNSHNYSQEQFLCSRLH